MAEVLSSSPVHYRPDESIAPADLEDETAAAGNSVFLTSDFMTAGDSSFDEETPASDASQMANPSDDGKVSVKKRRNSISQRNEAVAMNICKPDHNNDSNNSNNEQLSVLAVLITTFRRSLVACRANREEPSNMEISWPTNVRHVAHVTFDRFNGFLGLPVEFELEIPRRVPSASASVFGVSAESMQCSYDSKGNSVPTILLLMQERLYSQGGLKAEGIFRINAENSQEEHVRDQLNKGIVPNDIDVHCLAGLIKAWFRELPTGVLDSLTPEQVLQCNAEEECVELVKLLPPTQVALLNWAVDLMTDVVQEEKHNKMNARNIAMVFAPNMTQMSDPLTALMHAVQVMNFLKTLILKTLREREEIALGHWPTYCPDSRDEDGYDSTTQTLGNCEAKYSTDDERTSGSGEFLMDGYSHSTEDDIEDSHDSVNFIEDSRDSVNYIEEDFVIHFGEKDSTDDEELSGDSRAGDFSPSSADDEVRENIGARILERFNKGNGFQFREGPRNFHSERDQDKAGTSEVDSDKIYRLFSDKKTENVVDDTKGDVKDHAQCMVQMNHSAVKSRGRRVLSPIDQQIERVEAW